MKFIIHTPDDFEAYDYVFFGKAIAKLQHTEWNKIPDIGAVEYTDNTTDPVYEISYKKNKSSISLWGRRLT